MLAGTPGRFPTSRLRRTRVTPWMRALVAETSLTAADLIWPIFVLDGADRREPVASMPGVDRLSIDLAIAEVDIAKRLGVRTIALFPCTPEHLKTPTGDESTNPDNLMCRAIRALKDAHPDVGIVTDVALDPYTTHGHDGILIDGKIVNDATVEVLIRQAIAQAEAGADIIAPSDMMDGRIGSIRRALDGDGFGDVAVLAYAAKYASAFYGPFREAVGSAASLVGDKKTYQMDPANSDEAIREAELDLAEGADMIMVKPGLPYLDIVQRLKARFAVPTLVYHVSGEYAMLMAAAENGWLDRDRAILESLLCFKRAGADAILSYAAPAAARLLDAASG